MSKPLSYSSTNLTRARDYLEAFKEEDKASLLIFKKLTQPENDDYIDTAAKLWSGLEKAAGDRDGDNDYFWILSYIKAIVQAQTEKIGYSKTNRDRTLLMAKINQLSNGLTKLIRINGLDCHVFHNSESKIFPGFRIFEELGESNRTRIDNAGLIKVKGTDLIHLITSFATEELAHPLVGNRRGNPEITRVVRSLGSFNKTWFRAKKLELISYAVTLLYDAIYDKSRISELLTTGSDS